MDEVSPECKILFVVVFSPRPCYAHARKCIILNQIIIYYHYHIISYVIPVYDIHMRDNGIHNSMCILFTDCLRVYVYIYIYIFIYIYLHRCENFTARWLYINVLYNTYIYIIIILYTCCGCPPGDNTSRQLESSTDGKQKLFLFRMIVLK